ETCSPSRVTTADIRLAKMRCATRTFGPRSIGLRSYMQSRRKLRNCLLRDRKRRKNQEYETDSLIPDDQRPCASGTDGRLRHHTEQHAEQREHAGGRRL